MNEEDELALYGTPLKPLTEDNIHLAKAKKISDQIVTDKHGKRRFHGAFTGGFSAGYFNSVGSKEGWTPSTFVSSRSKRAENVTADPTMFMDDEDMDFFGIARRQIQPTKEYDDASLKTKRRKLEEGTGPIPGQPVLQELLKPANLTIGMQLLMKLGWKPGQGVGPRLSRKDKRKASQKKTSYSVQQAEYEMKSDSDEDCTGDPKLLFAPDDSDVPLLVNPKVDLFGLGYRPLDRQNILGSLPFSDNSSTLKIKEKNTKMSFKGQAFGVGAFEDDDDEIYGNEDMSKYDFSLGTSPEREGRQRNKNHPSKWHEQVSMVQKMLEGFTLSKCSLVKTKSYPLPVLPPNFQPWHRSTRRKFESKDGDCVNRSRPSFEERRKLIANPPSVEIRSGTKGVKPLSDTLSVSATSNTDVHFKNTFSEISGVAEDVKKMSSSLHGCFASWPEKQKRFEAYLRFRDCNDMEAKVFPSNMTEWEKEREREEFSKMAFRTSKPLSFSMSSRFTPAVHNEISENLKEGLNDMSKGDFKATPVASSSCVELPEDIKAAKSKMFGRLTQVSYDWVPDKLLCKRFNVPNPFPGSSTVGVPGKPREKVSIFNFLTMDAATSQSPFAESKGQKQPILPTEEPLNEGLSEEAEDSPDNFGLKVPVTNPPTMDLFKAIFQDSSDSESEGETPTTSNEPVTKSSEPYKRKSDEDNSSVKTVASSAAVNFSSNDERRDKTLSRVSDNILHEESTFGKNEDNDVVILPRAKGVFSGIDFKSLNEYREANQSKTPVIDLTSSDIKSEAKSSEKKLDSSGSSSEDNDEHDDYLPSLPPRLLNNPTSVDKSTTEEKLRLLKEIDALIQAKSKKLKKNKKERKEKKRKHKKDKKKKDKR